MKKFCVMLLGAFLLNGVMAGEWDVTKFKLHNGAVVEKDVLKLNGAKAYATIPGTEDIAIKAPGVTFACAVKAAYDLGKGDQNQMMDSYFSKPQAPFTICRWGKILSTRILNEKDKKYHIERVYVIPKAGQWTHLAFVLEPVKDKADTWNQCFYVNGKKVFDKTVEKFSPVLGKGPIEIGKGWGGPWMLTGEVADIHIVQKALNAASIGELVQKSRARR